MREVAGWPLRAGAQVELDAAPDADAVCRVDGVGLVEAFALDGAACADAGDDVVGCSAVGGVGEERFGVGVTLAGGVLAPAAEGRGGLVGRDADVGAAGAVAGFVVWFIVLTLMKSRELADTLTILRSRFTRAS